MNVLIVVDSSTGQLMLLGKLRSWGHSVTLATNERDAWDKVNQDTYELVISDWSASGIDGLELCRLIRQNPFEQYSYVILCTDRDHPADMTLGMEAGADDFLMKPIDFAELRVRIVAAQRVLQLQSELASQNQSIRRLNNDLIDARARIDRDIEAAAATQIRLLPQVHDVHPRARLDCLFIPSRFLGGDMLNYFMADDRHLILYQLDVSGQGIPAALLSIAVCQTLIPIAGSASVRMNSVNGRWELAAPADVVTELNTRFQSDGETYFTIVYGILDVFTRELRLCQAGHPSPVLLRRNSLPAVAGEGGFPVGLIAGVTYQDQIYQLAAGDRLIVYSNGVSDCENAGFLRYEQQRLAEMLDQNRDGSLEALMNGVREALGTWRGQAEFADDVSVLALECI